MPPMTISQVQAWRPWVLTTAALTAQPPAHQTQTEHAATNLNFALPAENNEVAQQVAAAVARAAHTFLEAAQTITTVRDDVLAAVQAAEADGYTVSDNGDVTLPPAPAKPAQARVVLVMRTGATDTAALAQRHQRSIKSALCVAEAADEAVTASLPTSQTHSGLHTHTPHNAAG